MARLLVVDDDPVTGLRRLRRGIDAVPPTYEPTDEEVREYVATHGAHLARVRARRLEVVAERRHRQILFGINKNNLRYGHRTGITQRLYEHAVT